MARSIGTVFVVAAFTIASAILGAPPAGATVASISPASATVDAGGRAAATVHVDASAVSCLDVSQPHGTISASVDHKCDGGSWSTTLTVATSADTPAGTYTVNVSDSDNSRSFVLTVRGPPATTTTRPTTTTTARPATTTRPTTTSTAEPTTVPEAATSTTASTTTAIAAAPGAQPFAQVAALVAEGPPTNGMFMPLLSDTFTTCLPLTRPCIDAASGIMLLPARRFHVTWAPTLDPAGTPPLLALADLPTLQAVGTKPARPSADASFLLTVLDLARDGELRSLARTVDANDQLVAVADGAAPPTSLVSSIEGSATLPSASATTAGEPFGPPSKMATTSLTEASPVLVAFASTPARLIYGVRANPEWHLGTVFVPLLGNGRVPYLVRGPAGPAGLLVPLPPGAAVPNAAPPPANSGRPRSSRAPIAVFAGVGAVVLAGGAIAAIVVARRRRPRFGR